METQYISIGIMFLGAMIFALAAMILSRILQPHRPYPEKLETYECGMETQGPTWVQFRISFFLYALIFLIFDVEAIFLIPWVVKFKELGLPAFVAMFIFLIILVLGFLYDWKEGALDWE